MAVVTDANRVTVSFSIEFHQCIKVANVFITVSHSDKNLEVLVTKRYIQVTIQSSNHKKNSSICRFEMSMDTFLPASTSGLSGQYFKHPEDEEKDSFKAKPSSKSGPLELTFRIHINDEMINESEMSERTCGRVMTAPVQIQTEYDLICRKCEKEINNSSLVFKRVLEKPSSDWQDLASEWFCHRHGDDDGLPTGIQESDLFYGNNRIFLHPDLITVEKGSNDSALCGRCNSHLGFLNKSSLLNEDCKNVLYELTLQTVRFRNKDGTDVSEEEPKSAVDTIVDLIQDQMEPIMMCKLCLESKGPSQSGGSLLLWVTDNTLHRYQTQVPLRSGLQTMTIEPTKVIRVLYNVTQRNSPLSVKWRKDFSIETQSVPDNIFWSAVDHLLNSTRTLPSSHRVMDDLWIGFLPRQT